MDTFSSDFARIRNMPAFVDKTLSIKAVLSFNEILFTSWNILLTAPPRFGKSVNLSMLKHFLEILPEKNRKEQLANRALFEGLLIEKEKDIMENHCGKHPIIFLDFKSSGSISSLSTARVLLFSAIQKAYKQHEYLASSDKLYDGEKKRVEKWCRLDFGENPKLKTVFALNDLARCLRRHWKKGVIVLVDNYDSISRDSLIHINDIKKLKEGRLYLKAEEEIHSIIDLFQGCLSHFFDSSHDVSRGIFTGELYITSCYSHSQEINMFVFKYTKKKIAHLGHFMV